MKFVHKKRGNVTRVTPRGVPLKGCPETSASLSATYFHHCTDHQDGQSLFLFNPIVTVNTSCAFLFFILRRGSWFHLCRFDSRSQLSFLRTQDAVFCRIPQFRTTYYMPTVPKRFECWVKFASLSASAGRTFSVLKTTTTRSRIPSVTYVYFFLFCLLAM